MQLSKQIKLETSDFIVMSSVERITLQWLGQLRLYLRKDMIAGQDVKLKKQIFLIQFFLEQDYLIERVVSLVTQLMEAPKSVLRLKVFGEQQLTLQMELLKR